MPLHGPGDGLAVAHELYGALLIRAQEGYAALGEEVDHLLVRVAVAVARAAARYGEGGVREVEHLGVGGGGAPWWPSLSTSQPRS